MPGVPSATAQGDAGARRRERDDGRDGDDRERDGHDEQRVPLVVGDDEREELREVRRSGGRRPPPQQPPRNQDQPGRQDGQQPSRDTFAWTVLSALAGEVDSTADVDDRVTITLLKRRSGNAR